MYRLFPGGEIGRRAGRGVFRKGLKGVHVFGIGTVSPPVCPQYYHKLFKHTYGYISTESPKIKKEEKCLK